MLRSKMADDTMGNDILKEDERHELRDDLEEASVAKSDGPHLSSQEQVGGHDAKKQGTHKHLNGTDHI